MGAVCYFLHLLYTLKENKTIYNIDNQRITPTVRFSVGVSTRGQKMNRQIKRIGIAWLLQSVFVLMLLLSWGHHHEAVASAATDCIDCAHHVHHSGHFTTSANHLDDCLLCHFLHLVYTTAATTVLVPLVILKQNRRCFLNSRTAQEKPSAFYTRGPPSVF